jgi:hypothetical protein
MVRLFSYLLCSFILMLASANVRAATLAEEPDVKAAFIYNFALYTEWPKPGSNLKVCIMGEDTLLTSMKKFEGRSAHGSNLRIESVMSASEARSCQVLFIGTSEHEHIDQINKTLEDAPVLTVTDSGKLTSYSTVIVLLIRNDDHLAFEINKSAATGKGLILSSKLLRLASKVR